MRLIGGQTLTVRRREEGDGWVDGEFVAAPSTTLEIWGSLQPLSDRDLQNLEEGQRTRAKHKLYVTRREIDLHTVDAQGQTLADRLIDPETGEELLISGTRDYPQRSRLRHRRYILLTPEA